MADDSTPPQSKNTNFWDVVIKAIDVVADKGSVTDLMLALFFVSLVWIQFERLDSGAAKDVLLYELEIVNSFPARYPVSTGLAVSLAFALWALQKQRKTYRREIKRLIPYRRVFMHYKEKCFNFIKAGVEAGEVASFDDLRKIEPEAFLDVERKSSRYDLEGEK